MKIFAKILPILLFVSSIHAHDVEHEELKQIFFQTLDAYCGILPKAVEHKDIAPMHVLVEWESPWHNFLKFTQEKNDFIMPYRAGGIRIYPLPFMTFLLIHDEFTKYRSEIKISHDNTQQDLYSFKIDGMEVLVRYKDKNMKFYRFISSKIYTFYKKPSLSQYFL